MRSRTFAGVVGVLALGAGALVAPAHSAAATCAGVPATIVGTTGDDELTGTPGDDVVAALDGNDVIDAGAGDDLVCGDAGSDQVTGGDGDDRLHGGDNGLVEIVDSAPEPFSDTLVPGPGDDLVDVLDAAGRGRRTRGVLDHARELFVVRLGGRPPVRARVAGVERVQMPHQDGRWTYLGTRGDDRVRGGAAYTARGRGGDVVLVGSYADDVLLGGPGRDRVVARRGVDRCRGEDLTGCEVALGSS